MHHIRFISNVFYISCKYFSFGRYMMHTLNLAWKLYWVYDSNQMGNEVYLFLTNDKKFCWWCYIQIGFQMPMKEVKRFLFVTFVFYSTWRLTGEMFGQMMLHNFFCLISTEVKFPITLLFCLFYIYLRYWIVLLTRFVG